MPVDMGFRALRCWLADDGRHVWQAHDCNGNRVVSMMPTIWKAEGGRVSPSIHCVRCGLHAFGMIESAPEGITNNER
jgi:hypothetical protein